MAKRNLFIMIIVLLLVSTPLVSADWSWNNVKRDLVIDKDTSKYGKIEIDDWYGLKNLMSLELKENTEICLDIGCLAKKEIIMYEDGVLIDDVRFIDLKTGTRTRIKGYDIYVNGDLYNGEEVSGYSGGVIYDVELRGEVYPYQTVDWQIKSAGEDWITEWANWNSSLVNGTRSYWSFDETSGTNVRDITGNYDLTSNSSNWTTGLINNGLAFNETQYASAFNESVFRYNATDFTVSCWMKPDTKLNKSNGGVHVFEHYDSAQNRIAVLYDTTAYDFIGIVNGEGIGQINLNTERTGSIYPQGHNASANEWVHLVLKWDYTNSNVSLWLNGSTINWTDYTGKLNTTTQSYPFAIGNGMQTTRDNFNRTFDECSVHDRALSTVEIQDIFNSGVGKNYKRVVLNSPEDNYNITVANNSVTFNCSSFVGLLDVHNLSIYHNATGTWTLNQTNSTVINSESTSTFDVIFNDYIEGITWNCYACDSNDYCSYGDNRTLNIKETTVYSIGSNTTTWETDTEDFFVSALGNGSVLTANLWYNGTSYTGTKIGDNYDATFTRTIDIPTAVGNRSHHWEIFSDGVSAENTSSLNQTINSTLLGLCNASLTTPYINYSFRDEENGTVVNGSVDITYWDYYLGSGAYNKSFIFSNVTNISYAFCLNPDVGHKTLHQATIVQYYGTNYPQRRWTSAADLTNATLNQTLYLLDSADGIYSVYQTQTSGGVPITTVTVQVERQFSGVWSLVEQGVTDGAGAVTFWLNPDYDHRFTFTKTNYASVQEIVRPSSSTYTVVMAGSADEDVAYNETKSLQGIRYSYAPASGRLEKDTVQTFTFNVTASLSNLLNYSIQIRNESGSILNRTSGTTATGNNLSVTLNTSVANKLWGRYYVDVGAGMVLLDGDAYWLTNITDYTPERGTLWHFFYYSTSLSEFGGENNRAEFSRVVGFFLILTVLLSALCFMTGWDFSSPGGILTLIVGIVWFGSFSGFLTLTGISIWPTVDKYALAFVVSLIWFGYSLNTVRRQTS